MSVPLAITLVAAIAILVVYVLLAVRLWQRTWHSLSEPDRGPSSYRANMANLILYTLLIGVTSLAQLDEDLDAWDTPLSPELLAAIDAVRWEVRDPAQ